MAGDKLETQKQSISENAAEHPRHATATATMEHFEIISPHTSYKDVDKLRFLNDDAPLVDTTAALVLRSKKTERTKKRTERKKAGVKPRAQLATASLLDLPFEVLEEVLSWLRPSDLNRLQRVNRALRDFIAQEEAALVREITRKRYSVLSRSFHLPQPLSTVSPAARRALLSDAWQEKLLIHKLPYSNHIPMHDPQQICSCLSCVLAWNNLCLALDLAHFALHLAAREPLPIIPRGQRPAWNCELLSRHAGIVNRAMQSPLTYALILQTHLATTVAALTRRIRVAKNRTIVNPRPQYEISAREARSETDSFLARKGPPSYEFPFARDNYYSLEAYVPNRKWSHSEAGWLYALPGQPHVTEVTWVLQRFGVPEDTPAGDYDSRRRNNGGKSDERCSRLATISA